MAAPCYVGDEATAAGFRLAGLATIVPEPGREPEALAEARSQAPLVLLCAAVAVRLDPASLRAALAAPSPPVALVPAIGGDRVEHDVGVRIARTLGLEG